MQIPGFFLAEAWRWHIIGVMQAIKATTTLILALGLAAAFLAQAQETEELMARIKSDRVNLRAKPDGAGEVVAQATLDERLRVLAVEPEWVRVSPPDRVDLWIHKDFVKDGLSVGEKVNVRAGAGINFSVVGHYTRGERVEVRGQFGEWLKVAPSNAAVWVSREFVDLLYPARVVEPAPAPLVDAPAPQPAQPLPAGPVEPMNGEPALGPVTPILASTPGGQPAPPTPVVVPPGVVSDVDAPRDLKLVPLEGQGRLVQYEGDLKPAPFMFGRPSKFRITRRTANQLHTICFVRGNTRQLESLLNQRLIVRGREYWVQGVRQPVLVLERIERPAQ